MNPSDVKQRYQDEQVARSYDRVRFSGPIGRMIDALEKRAFKKALNRVRRDLPSPKVLDIPCGTGRITEVLLEAGLDVIGGDISFPMMEIAQNKLARYGDRVSFRHLDLEGINLPDDGCDLVSCIRLFNHLGKNERTRILRELARVSRRYIILNVSFWAPFYRFAVYLKRLLGIPAPKEPSPWNELNGEIAAAGMRIEAYFFELRFLSEVVILVLRKIRE
jgi:ubiquinone/menaquinone biosynthesis C-methylase UbiE